MKVLPLVAASAALLLVSALPAVEFEPPAPLEAGMAWDEDARWHMTGRTKASLGKVPVRDRVDDDGTHYDVRVRVEQVAEGRPSSLRYAFRAAGRVEGGAPESVELDGVEVVAEGLGAERRFLRGDGKRLKRKARSFLEEQFADGGDADPVQLLLPPGPVGPGESWELDWDRIIDLLGSERFTLDRQASFARATLQSVTERGGERLGRIAYDVLIVPASITDAEITEARMGLRGVAELPLSGRGPSRGLELELETRFEGSFKRKGVHMHLDFDHVTTGTERRVPVP